MHNLVANDAKSQLITTLVRQDTGSPVDLTGLDVFIKIRAKKTTITLLTIQGAVADGTIVFSLAAFLLTRAAGYYEGELYTSDVTGKEIVYELVDFHVRSNFT